ncbi:MAG: acyl-CoA dehydrogenase [Planctomycetes bacterium]|nr:acyl-CoA dehydrogenase [Planctomycetota bacterium]
MSEQSKSLPPLDDLYRLPFFSDEDRAFVEDLRGRLSDSAKIEIEGDGSAALVAWVRRLGEWRTLETLFGNSIEDTSLLRVCLAREVLAEHCIIADLALVMQFLGGLPLYHGGSTFVAAAFDSIQQGKSVAAFAITEPEAGTDLSRISTSATFDDGSYIINGHKHLISNVGAADLFTLFARLEGGDSTGRIAAFALPAEIDGVTQIPTPPMVPHPIGRLELNNVVLGKEHLLGVEGKGMRIALETLGFCRPTVGAAANGMARRAIAEAWEHVTTRQAFGGVLADKDLIKAGLSECIVDLDAARLLVYRAAWARDQAPKERHDRAASSAKWRATESAQRVIDKCLQFCGGVATLQGHILAELYQGLRPLRIYEGASEIHSLLVFDSLKGELGNVTKSP